MSRTLPFFIVSILVRLVFATPLGIVPSPLTITDGMLHWASLGDSWATGVTWKKELDYDEDHDEVIRCRRSKESYAYQMSQNDLLFPKEGQVFKWPACSGSGFAVMAAQAEQMDEGTSFATLTIGGNQLGWDNMVQSCIYVPDPLRVICSPEYPDSAGDCYKAIELTKSKLNNDEEFLKAIPVMIGAVMDRGKAKNGDFQLYVTNYAHPFNVDPNWCDEQSFGMFWCRPSLTSELRRAFNDIAETLKQKIEEGVQYFQDNDHNGRSLHYVEISKGFDTHRFCETNHTFEDQWDDNPNSENVWLYNPPKPPWVPQMPMQRDVDKWLSEHPENDIGIVGPPDRPGSVMRPFHPKTKGFKSIADEMIGELTGRGK